MCRNDCEYAALGYTDLDADWYWAILYAISGVAQFRLFGRQYQIHAWSQSGMMMQVFQGIQAFVTGLASRVGVGNVAGVAIAVVLAVLVRYFGWLTA